MNDPVSEYLWIFFAAVIAFILIRNHRLRKKLGDAKFKRLMAETDWSFIDRDREATSQSLRETGDPTYNYLPGNAYHDGYRKLHNLN